MVFTDLMGSLGGTVVNYPPVMQDVCSADMDSIPGSGRYPGEGERSPFLYFWWKIPWTEEMGYSHWDHQCVKYNLEFSSPWITVLSWWRDLCNSVKLWAIPCGATWNRWIIMKTLTKHCPLEREVAAHFSIIAWRTPWTVWNGKRYDSTWWAPQVRRYPVCYGGRAESH